MPPTRETPTCSTRAATAALLTRYDRRTGQMRRSSLPANPMGQLVDAVTERCQWTFPIVFAPTDSRVIYVGSQHLWRTTSEGQSWERVSPDLTRAPTRRPSADRRADHPRPDGVETYATIFTIAPVAAGQGGHLDGVATTAWCT